MIKTVKLERKITPQKGGKQFIATIHHDESMDPLDVIQMEKSILNSIQNRKDQIKAAEMQIEQIKTGIKSQEKAIKEEEINLRTVRTAVTVAKRNLSKKEKKELVEIEKKEAEFTKEREDLIAHADRVKKKQEELK